MFPIQTNCNLGADGTAAGPGGRRSPSRAAPGRSRRRDVDVVVPAIPTVPPGAERGDRLFPGGGHVSGGATTFLDLDTRSGVAAVHHGC